MTPATKFWRMPITEKMLRGKTLLHIVAVRLALWVLPFRTVRNLAQRMAVRSRRPGSRKVGLDRLIYAVVTTSQYVPGATCLTQALAAQILVSRYGYATRLNIGVAKVAPGPFEAHAWLEYDGVVILGGEDTNRYTPLLAMENDLETTCATNSRHTP